MPRLTDNFCRQNRDESLADVPRYADGPQHVRFTHVVNPYRCQSEQEMAVQQLTFETIRNAVRIAAPFVKVRCVCVTNQDDLDLVPADFIAARPLTRTVLDVATFRVRRALPLIFDILDHGIGVADDPPEIPGCEDFIIFTNMDIHLQPHFYLVILEFIRAGYDMIDVHRRTIPQYSPLAAQLPVMFSEEGIHHGGLDCITFPRRKYQAFVRNNACVGMSLVMKGILVNCTMQAKRFLVLANARLTFHLGNERAWAAPLFGDYESFNRSEFLSVMTTISQDRADAQKLLNAFRSMQFSPRLVALVEEATGIRSPQPRAHQVIFRKMESARRRLLLAGAALTERPE
jgi:hypothetical protein